MDKKIETKKLIARLEKKSREDKKKVWKKIAEILGKPTRHNVVVNLEKLDVLSKKNKGKVLVVPGRILSKGEYTGKETIVCFSASEKAVEKGKNNLVLLKDFIEKGKAKDVIIVK